MKIEAAENLPDWFLNPLEEPQADQQLAANDQEEQKAQPAAELPQEAL